MDRFRQNSFSNSSRDNTNSSRQQQDNTNRGDNQRERTPSPVRRHFDPARQQSYASYEAYLQQRNSVQGHGSNDNAQNASSSHDSRSAENCSASQVRAQRSTDLTRSLSNLSIEGEAQENRNRNIGFSFGSETVTIQEQEKRRNTDKNEQSSVKDSNPWKSSTELSNKPFWEDPSYFSEPLQAKDSSSQSKDSSSSKIILTRPDWSRDEIEKMFDSGIREHENTGNFSKNIRENLHDHILSESEMKMVTAYLRERIPSGKDRRPIYDIAYQASKICKEKQKERNRKWSSSEVNKQRKKEMGRKYQIFDEMNRKGYLNELHESFEKDSSSDICQPLLDSQIMKNAFVNLELLRQRVTHGISSDTLHPRIIELDASLKTLLETSVEPKKSDVNRLKSLSQQYDQNSFDATLRHFMKNPSTKPNDLERSLIALHNANEQATLEAVGRWESSSPFRDIPTGRSSSSSSAQETLTIINEAISTFERVTPPPRESINALQSSIAQNKNAFVRNIFSQSDILQRTLANIQQLLESKSSSVSTVETSLGILIATIEESPQGDLDNMQTIGNRRGRNPFDANLDRIEENPHANSLNDVDRALHTLRRANEDYENQEQERQRRAQKIKGKGVNKG
jgi:hypothetical protein